MEVLKEGKRVIKKNSYIYMEDTENIMEKLDIRYITDRTPIDDLEIEDNENNENNEDNKNMPNVLIYKNEDNVSFENIISSVRILITSMSSIRENRYESIPNYIERIIINGVEVGRIGELRIEMVEYIEQKNAERYIRENYIEKKRYNERTNKKENILIMSIKKRLKNIYEDIVSNMDIRVLYERDKKRKCALEYALEHGEEKLGIRILERIEGEMEEMDNNMEILKSVVIKNRSQKITGMILRMNEEIYEYINKNYKLIKLGEEEVKYRGYYEDKNIYYK